ncbi:MAG: MurR/RpiR family transcriptional regulator [Acholeplasmataceae bacterium]|jgi:DNA-binding MurR/RpiR family transcriptional regulator
MKSIETILEAVFREKAKRLTRTEKKIHDYVIKNPEQVIYSTINQIATILGVSDASVVRYFVALGYSNFIEFKMDLFKHHDSITKISNGSLSEQIYENIVTTLDETKNNINLEDVQKAAEIIVNSDNVVLCGMGVSNITAKDAYSKLLRIGINIEFVDDAHFLFMRTSLMGKNDVLITYSFTGETNEVIRASRTAKNNGAKIISVTSYLLSDLVTKSDIVIKTFGYDKSIDLGFNSQKISQLYVTDLLITCVALKNREKSLANIKLTTQSLMEDK